MRWDDFRRSDNVEDARGERSGGGLPGGAGGMSIGAVVVLGLIGWALGIDPRVLIGAVQDYGTSAPAHYGAPPTAGTPGDRTGQFVAAVLGDTEDRWGEIFQRYNRTYRAPKLRLFTGYEQSACGAAQSAMGPFYCPNDQRVYLDTSFFRDLEQRFRGCSGNACEFAYAYVIAHEVGHHVQNLLGVLPQVSRLQRGGDQAAANRLQVRVELQADCYAGIWAYQAQQKLHFIDPGDIEAALQSAAAIGDDRLQRRSQGYVVPDAFTHGSSAQRVRWFKTGFTSGKVESCDTFNARDL